jgi:N-acetyl-gamma-glutamyl-phosphate reductase
MNTVFIDGEAGTTGLQIRERLAGRSDITLISIDADRRKDPAERKRLLNAADVAILCLPDEASREAVSLIENDTTRVIDASTAYRVAEGWAYGFAEMTADQAGVIAGAKRVANPGCWPQGLIASLRPLIEAGLVPADAAITYNGVSGYSGGGKKMIEDYEGAADPAPDMPYALGFNHKHLPEMTAYTGLTSAPLFVPVVGNFAQGMVNYLPLRLDTLPGSVTPAEIHAALADRFAGSTFVKVAPLQSIEKTPDLDPRRLNGTNALHLRVFANAARGHVVIVSQYDNLGKGASGAAVQNLNLMLGLDPAAGLTSAEI